MSNYKIAKELMEFIDRSPSMYHSTENLAKMAADAGFAELKMEDGWKIEVGRGYYVKTNNSAIAVFNVGEDLKFNIIGSHSDSPSFKIKPNPEKTVADHFITVNTEPYGGAIYSTWFDRPLSVAGRVVYEKNSKLFEQNVNIDKNLLIIANAAIHMNREINNGYKYQAQKDLLPIIGQIGDKLKENGILMSHIAQALGIDVKDIVDYDLYLYDRQPGNFVGPNDEFFSVGRIDNLGMAYVSVKAVLEQKAAGINLAMVFDNEEVGSGSRQGAAGTFMTDLMQRICLSLSDDPEAYYRAVSRSFLISADQAHSVHPNYLEYSDITNYPKINKGVAVKYAANKSYTSDSVSASMFKMIAKAAGAPVQSFVNHSDKRGGSTIGPISVRKLNIPALDIGAPILSMHSVRELGGSQDQEDLYRIFMEFYKAGIGMPETV